MPSTHTHRPSSSIPLILPAIFTLVALVLLLPALLIAFNFWNVLGTAESTPGRVVALEYGSNGGARPVIEYEVHGEPYELVGPVISNPPAYAVGDPVTVFYPPGAPRDARIHSFVELWLLPLILGGIGSIFGLIAGIMWVAFYHERRS